MKKLLEFVEKVIRGKQRPESIKISSLGMKGYWIDIVWIGSEGQEGVMSIDYSLINKHHRVVGGNIAPNYIQGVHRYWNHNLAQELENIERFRLTRERKDEIIEELKDIYN